MRYGGDSPEEIARLPLRPMYEDSTAHPAMKAAGTPIKLRITCCCHEVVSASPRSWEQNAYVAVSDVKGSVSECGTSTRQPLQMVSCVEWYLHLRSQVRQKTVIERRRKTDDPLGKTKTRLNRDVLERTGERQTYPKERSVGWWTRPSLESQTAP